MKIHKNTQIMKTTKVLLYVLFLFSRVSLYSQTVNITASGSIGVSCSEYLNNMNKTWNITIPVSKKLALDYTVRTEPNYDKVLIYSINDSGTAILQATLSGSQNGQIGSLYPNGKMRVVFTSDGSVNCSTNSAYSGFSISISYVEGIAFAYDASGNRTGRTITLGTNGLRSNTMEEEKEEETVLEEQLSYPVAEMVQQTEIRIYPNPTEGRFTVEIGNLSNEVQGIIYLLDMHGRQVAKKEIESKRKIDFDLGGKAAGIYILNIYLGEAVSTWKIVKK